MNGAMFAGQSYLQEILKALQELNLTFNFGSGLVSIAAYVLLALGLYGIAKKRGIHYPWLAWLPVGNAWLLGCISDQYRFVVKGETKNRRKRMLVLSVINLALALLMIVLIVSFVIQMGGWAFNGLAAEGLSDILVMAVLLLLLLLPVAVISIWLTVETFCGYYDVFRSCSPADTTLYTVLSIIGCCLGLNILASIFVFICRNKEEGMPPRKEVPVQYDESVQYYQEVTAPVYQDEEPFFKKEDEPPFVEQ
jgi:hypothetical protein